MRISLQERDAIKESVHGRDPNAQVYLFGSRVDDTKQGGDIDLLILSRTIEPGDKSSIRRDICEKIGWQKIDIVIAKDTTEAFVRIALAEGILL